MLFRCGLKENHLSLTEPRDQSRKPDQLILNPFSISFRQDLGSQKNRLFFDRWHLWVQTGIIDPPTNIVRKRVMGQGEFSAVSFGLVRCGVVQSAHFATFSARRKKYFPTALIQTCTNLAQTFIRDYTFICVYEHMRLHSYLAHLRVGHTIYLSIWSLFQSDSSWQERCVVNYSGIGRIKVEWGNNNHPHTAWLWLILHMIFNVNEFSSIYYIIILWCKISVTHSIPVTLSTHNMHSDDIS